MVLMKQLAIQDWMVHSEKASILTVSQDGGGVGLGEGPVGSELSAERERQELAQQIYERGREAVVVLPPGFDLKLVEATANTEHMYSAQMKMADTAIAIAIRGGNLTTEVQSGSRAAAEAQERLGDEVNRRFDGQAFTSTIHDQSLEPWAEYNFGDRSLAPWPVMPTGPKRDIIAKAAALVAAAQAGMALQKFGYSFDPEMFAEEFEITPLIVAGKFEPQLDFDRMLDKMSVEAGILKTSGGSEEDTSTPSRVSPDTFAKQPNEFEARRSSIKDEDLILPEIVKPDKEPKE